MRSRPPLATLIASLLAPTLATPAALAQTTPPASQPQYTITQRVPITIVDVVVTDAKGRPVHDLKRSDFTVFEDKQEMAPNSFEEHRSDGAPTTSPPARALPANTFTNADPVVHNAASINVLLLDALNTPAGVQQIVQQEMLAFVKKMQPGTRLAVFNLMNTHLSILQGFTSDPELLNAAITDKRNTAQAATVEDRGQDPAHNDDPVSPITCEVELERATTRAQYTFSAMRQLARYLAGLPGRKNLIWFTGSFPMQDSCSGASAASAKGTDQNDLTGEMTLATDLLARAHVTIYPVDPRALDCLAGGRCSAKEKTERLTMEALAEWTGGKATYLTNDLAGTVFSDIDLGSNFYTITYTPKNQALDTRFRTITVKTSIPGLHLTYRDGYYVATPDIDLAGKKIEKLPPMQTALLRGSLQPTEITFRVTAQTAPAQPSPTPNTTATLQPVSLPANNEPNPKLLHPPYRIITLSYLIDISHIDFNPGPDGNYRGAFEYGVRVYNADGDEIVNAASKEVHPILPPAVFQSMLRGGANAHQEIAIPATGDYFLRVAVHDLNSNRIGAVEIPTAALTPTPAK